MEVLRTPEARFEGLTDYPFAPHYVVLADGEGGSLRMHYVDEGPRDAAHTWLCLHGQPTWSYLYRHMIPVFTAAGHRVIAPDLIGFGKSDKPVEDSRYSFHFHRDLLMRFIEALDLRGLTLVCQDWGGILGLTLPPDMPDRFDRLVVMNTALPVGQTLGEGFDAWRAFNRSQPDLDIAGLMTRAVPGLTAPEAAAYAAPFPAASYKAGVRRFPELVMTDPGMDGIETSRRARTWWAERWHGPTFMAVGMQDPVLGAPLMAQLRETLQGCPPPLEVEEAGHFVQEAGARIARAALAAFDT
jgi:pimeloyl-ACP methyl ester carboxylesterase